MNTAEEWVLYNPSLTLWGHTDVERFPQRGEVPGQFRSYPVERKEGQTRFWKDHEFRIVTHAADHPFHIHVNPMWVTRIEVPDELATTFTRMDRKPVRLGGQRRAE